MLPDDTVTFSFKNRLDIWMEITR